MPQAIEWSLATPMIRPRLPCISCVMPPNLLRYRPTHARAHELTFTRASDIEALEHNAGIGAAETERVRQHAAELHVVATFAQDRHVREGGIERLDICAFADEAAVHHQ